MSNKLLYALLTLLIQTTANQVLPVFSGYWYTSAHYLDQDACYHSSYIYEHWAKDSAEHYAYTLLQNVPPHLDCQWGQVFLNAKTQQQPVDFMSSNQDWHSISQQYQAITGQNWQRYCLNAQGRLIDSRSLTIWPHYRCPNGSYFYQGMGQPSCSNESQSCHADSVARDLNAPPLPADAGYLGLINMGRGITSVLTTQATPDAIIQQPLSHFKKIAPFWGERFGLSQKPRLSLLEASNIIRVLKNQQDLSFNYTLGWHWHPGYRAVHPVYDDTTQRWLNIYGDKEKALFRNDSLVYYGYLHGANLKILSGGFSFGVLPADLYQAFLYPRFNGKKIPLVTTVTPFFSRLGFNDIVIQQTLDNPQVPRLSKLTTLYNLSKQYQDSPLLFEYFIDTLFEYQPIELTHELIDLYHQQHSLDNKYRLLARLDEIISVIAAEPDSQRAVNITKVLAVQQLYDAIMNTETQPLLLKMVMQKYPQFTAPDKAKAMIDLSFQRIEQQRLKVNFTTGELSALRLQVAFATTETQLRDLPELLTHPEDSGRLPYQVCAWLQAMPTLSVNYSLKAFLQEYLLQHQRLISDPRDLQAAYPTCNWLRAYATVSIDNDLDKNNFMFKTIRDTPEPLTQARYLSQQRVNVLAQLPREDLQAYLTQMTRLLTMPLLSDADRQWVKLSLSHLQTTQQFKSAKPQR